MEKIPNLKKIIIVCVAFLFIIKSIANINIVIHDNGSDVLSGLIARILFITIDFSIGVWLLYNLKTEINFMQLMIVHFIASPSIINELVTSHHE
jgi:hypothetical protein